MSSALATRGQTFVGIGFGPIQGGLFLYEAAHSGAFARLVASEIVAQVVKAVNDAGGYSVCIAHADRIEVAEVSPVRLHNPAEAADFAALVEAIAQASAIATALPSVEAYSSDSPGAPDRLLAAGLQRKWESGGPLAVIYAGENHNHAAEILSAAVAACLPIEQRASILARVAFVNTVIGKMSGYAKPTDLVDAEKDTATVHASSGKQELARIAPGLERAFLVEAFSNILISPIRFADADAGQTFVPGIARFTEKHNLLPFEEAKLYVHNGMHAFAAYLGKIAGCTSMAQLRHVPGMLSLVRVAALEEPGSALVRKYAGVDALFTAEGMQAYIDDLIARMVNPLLDDSIARVARDPQRKLAWDDRLVGSMRVALDQGIQPRRFALAAAAALADLVDANVERTGPFPWGVLVKLWQRPDGEGNEVAALEAMIAESWPHLEAFRGASSDTPVAPAHGAMVHTQAGDVTYAPLRASAEPASDSAKSSGQDSNATTGPSERTETHWGENAPVYYRWTDQNE